MKQECDFSKAVRGKFFREGADLQLPICSDRGSGTHQRPNLFNYATSELSQDAFICWLVACAAKATGDLQKCGLEFVRTLFRVGASDRTGGVPVLGPDGEPICHNGPCDVSDVSCLRPQYNKIDVYFRAKVDGKRVSFIIEDKKDGSVHSNQLARYLKAAIKEEEEEDLIKPVYFKTGYVFSDERDIVEQNNYSVFEAEDLKRFLEGQDATRENEILRQYEEYLACQMKTRADTQASWDLKQDHVQWEFMLKLRDVVESAAGEWQAFVLDELSGFPDWTWGGLGRGKNKGGGSWTQYWFAQHLFWRLDQEKPLRLMISLSSAGQSVEESNGMMSEYQSCFDRALQEEGLSEGGARRVRGNERTIGSVATTNFQGMTASEFLNRVTRVHIRFLDMIEAKVELMKKLWCEVDSALKKEIRDLPSKSKELSDVSEETIRGFKEHGLYYPFGSGAASLGIVQEEGRIFFGVYYDENQDEYRELEAALNAVLRNVPGSDQPTNGWLWWTWADGNLKEEEYSGRIAQGLKPVWAAIKRASLA